MVCIVDIIRMIIREIRFLKRKKIIIFYELKISQHRSDSTTQHSFYIFMTLYVGWTDAHGGTKRDKLDKQPLQDRTNK
jgi:hypothetical protein